MDIISSQYIVLGYKTTICLLTLANGFEIVGTAACVDPKDFDFNLGKTLAHNNALDKLGEYQGLLKQIENNK